MRRFRVALYTRTVKIATLMLLVAGAAGGLARAGDQIYTFTDERGVPHFSNVPGDVRYKPLSASSPISPLPPTERLPPPGRPAPPAVLPQPTPLAEHAEPPAHDFDPQSGNH